MVDMKRDTNQEIPMRCNIRGCTKRARWIVNDSGVDTNLCPEHLDEFKEVQKKMQEELDAANLKQYGST
jgi:hypothetical protein